MPAENTVAVVMYATRHCPYCVAARQLLAAEGIAYRDIAVDGRPDLRDDLRQRSGQGTVPQIWFGEQHIGGYSELSALQQRGKLSGFLPGR